MLMSRHLLPAAIGAVFLALPVHAQEPSHHLVEVPLPSEQARQRLLELDLDLVTCNAVDGRSEHAEVIATDADLAALRGAELAFEVLIRDLEAHHEAELSAFGPFEDLPNPPLGQGAMGGHYTLAQVISILDDFAANYPSICSSRVSLGQSHQGRDIWMVKISDNVGVDENEPEVLYDALHHAREPLSMETTLLFMEQLLQGYGVDPELTYIVDNRELYFVPVVNPDGYEYNRQIAPNGGGMWRKNRRNNGGSFGVDLNRNYSDFWGLPGASSTPSSSTYRGPSAFSEPETAALRDFAATRSFVQVVSTHSFTDVLLTPYGWTTQNPSNNSDYQRVGAIATEQTGIDVEPFSVGLNYLGSGTAQDFHHETHGALSWTPELGRSSEGGFWPNPTNTVNIANRHANMFRKIALLSGPNLTDGEIILMSNGDRGTDAIVGMLGHPTGTGLLALASGTANIVLPGFTGTLQVAPATAVWAYITTFGSTGYDTYTISIPNDPFFVGIQIHWQMLHLLGASRGFGNLETLTIK